MNIAIISKIGGALLFSGSTAVIGILIIDQDKFGVASGVYLYATGGKASTNNTTGINSDQKNYKCNFKDKNKDAVDCTIYKLKTDKNKYLLDSVKKADTKLNDTDVQTETNIIKVVLNSHDWKESDKVEKIEVVKDNKSSSDHIYAELTIFLTVKKGKKTWKTKNFIAQVESKDEVTNITNCKCKFDEYSTEQDCKIYDFAETKENEDQSNGYKNLTFKKPNSTESTNIAKDKHYLIQFTTEITSENFAEWYNKNMYYQKDEKNKVTFKNVTPAFYKDNEANIFIF